MSRIVIVGASLGGLRAAEALRAGGWRDEIVVLGEEPHMPYTRPPLSKAALRTAPALSSVALRLRPEVLGVRWRLGSQVTAADLGAREVFLADGSALRYDGLVAATGVRARRLPLDLPPAFRHVVRTFDDCARLQAELRPGRRVLIAGAGFIGCEVAATARQLGCSVDVVAQDRVPMALPLGDMAGRAVRQRHEAHGVTFHLGRTVTGADPGDGAPVARLDDGTVLGFDVLVEAVGSRPATQWLEGNGLDLTDGIRTDNELRIGALPGAVAVGDVARFPNPLFDAVPRRVEHWQMPGETARQAASTLLAQLAGRPPGTDVFRPLPSFWSDQFDLRLQSFGAPALADEISVLEGDLAEQAVIGYRRAGTLVGAVLLGLARQAPRWRREVLQGLLAGAAVAG